MGGPYYDIDAVVAWVDGNDPAHRSKRLKYADSSVLVDDEVGGDIRFANAGEIFFCVASLLRFAPFIRKIFIVTDGQDPKADVFADKYFPDRTTAIEIVDHSVIFRGYERYLPVFNSLSIETVLWRIPDLSEHFIYLNDDFMLSAPVVPEDFFIGGKPVCRASRFSIPFGRFLHMLRPLKYGTASMGFKDAMINAARLIGKKGTFLYFDHYPHPQLKSVFAEFYEGREDVMVRNMKPKFREPYQFNSQELMYLLAKDRGQCVLAPKCKDFLYIKPKKKAGYISGKLRYFRENPKARFCCLNSLSYASEEDIAVVRDWVWERLGMKEKILMTNNE